MLILAFEVIVKPQLHVLSLHFFQVFSTLYIATEHTHSHTYTGTQHTDGRNLVTNYQFNDEKVFSRTSGNKKQQHKRTIQHTTHLRSQGPL